MQPVGILVRIMRTEQPTVGQIDEVRITCFGRLPGEPSGRRERTRQPVEIRKAKSRLRTAAWRANLRQRRRPETNIVAIAFLVSLIAVARKARCEVEDLPETKAAFEQTFVAMQRQGYAVPEVMAVVRRLARLSRASEMPVNNI